MKRSQVFKLSLLPRIGALLLVIGMLSVGCPHRMDSATAAQRLRRVTARSLERFSSAREFDTYVARVRRVRAGLDGGLGFLFGCAMSRSAEAPAAQDSSITNNQEQGVDEGDIVKAVGDHFVILRRGRLFTVRQRVDGEPALRAIDRIDVSPEGFTKATWYDEMLVHEDRVVVIGYSYQLGATEIGMYSVDEQGKLAHRGTAFISSNDYYSSRNYASRLVEGQLVLYMPYSLFSHGGWGQPDASLPTLRTWQRGDEVSAPRPILARTMIYRPVQPSASPTLHTVVRCDLGEARLRCGASAVLGPYSRSFYVSSRAIYVWVGAGHEPWGASLPEQARAGESDASFVYRLPLDGGVATALRARGVPIDQFSFKETEQHLNVVLSSDGRGDAMWGAEHGQGALALLRAPLDLFGATPRTAHGELYRPLPRPEGYTLHNRFVGDHLLYGTGDGWWRTEHKEQRVYVTRVAGDDRVHALELGHGVERIEALGDAALVAGGDGQDLHLSAVTLEGPPRVASRFTQPDARQGETRSHGFFFKPDGEGGGTLGLPVRSFGQGYHQLRHGSAEVVYLRVDPAQRFTSIGALAAAATDPLDDRCQVSCADWYGNARPIFYRDRTFALLGYELVEGRVVNGELRELERLNYFAATEPHSLVARAP